MAAMHEPTTDRRPPAGVLGRHPARLAIVVLTIVGAAIGAAVVFSQAGSGKARTDDVVVTLRVPGVPNAIAAGPDAVWAALNGEVGQTAGKLLRVDLATGSARKTVNMPGVLGGAARIDGSLWVDHNGDWQDSTPGELDRVDWHTGNVLQRIRFDGPVFGFASGKGLIWLVVGRAPATLVRIDPTQGVVQGEPIRINGSRVIGLAYGDGAVWATAYEDGTLLKIDPNGGHVQKVDVGNGPVGVTVAHGSVWVANRGSGTVSRVDPQSMHAVGKPIGVGHNPTWIAAVAGSIWVSNQTDGTVSRIDPGTDKVVETTRTAPGTNGDQAAANALAVAGGSLWVSSNTEKTLSRIDPSR
jgi:streptogramin lyase